MDRERGRSQAGKVSSAPRLGVLPVLQLSEKHFQNVQKILKKMQHIDGTSMSLVTKFQIKIPNIARDTKMINFVHNISWALVLAHYHIDVKFVIFVSRAMFRILI